MKLWNKKSVWSVKVSSSVPLSRETGPMIWLESFVHIATAASAVDKLNEFLPISERSDFSVNLGLLPRKAPPPPVACSVNNQNHRVGFPLFH